jgi:AcrR family transcriptional regulator
MGEQAHRTARGEARLRALTETAADLFLEKGFEALSLDDLIARVGGSRRNIYGRFGNKEGLFVAIVTSLCEELSAPLKSLDIPRTGNLAEALQPFGRELLRIVLLPRTLAIHRLMIAEAPRYPHLAQAIWQAGHAQAANMLTAWIVHQQESGLLRKDTAAAMVAQNFVDLVVADAQLKALIGIGRSPDAAECERIVTTATAVFLQGYGTVFP